MKGKNKKEKRKIVMSVLAVILAIAMVLSLASPFFAAEIADEKITIEAQAGFDGNYRIGGLTPISITISNNGENLKGEIQLKILQYKYDTEANYIIYAQEIEIPSFGTKQAEFNVKLPTLQKNIEVSVVCEDKTVASKKISVNPCASDDTFVAMLTDNADNNFLYFMKNLKIRANSEELVQKYGSANVQNAQTVSTQEGLVSYGWNRRALNELLIFMKDKDFPKDKDVLRNFNAVIIDNFDTSSLDTAQLDILNDWLEEGGSLILGTGASKNKVMKGLGKIVDESQGIRLAVLGEKEDTFLQYKGNGVIIIHDFDLAFSQASQNSNISEYLTNFYLSNCSSLLNYNVDEIYADDYYNDYYMLRNVPIEENISTKLMFAIVGIYILILGPVLYVILKKKDRLERSWVIMPIMAAAVMVILSFISLGTPYKNYIVNSISFIQLENGTNNAKVKTNAAIFSPKKGNIEAVFQQKGAISNVNNYNYYGYYDNGGKSEDVILYKYVQGEEDKINFYNNASWSSDNSINIEHYKNFEGNIDARVSFEDGKMYAEVTNNLGYELEDVIVLLGSAYAHYDKIASGETLKSEINPDFGNYYSFSRNIIKADDEKDTYKVRKAERRRRLFEDIWYRNGNRNSYGLYSYSKENMPIVHVYAFTDEQIFKVYKTINSKEPISYNDSIFTVDVPINLNFGQNFAIPNGIINFYNVFSSSAMDYYEQDKMIYVYDAATVEFYFKKPEGSRLDEFEFTWERTYSGMSSSRQIYNCKTSEWETLSEGPYTDTQNYIDENGDIAVRIGVSAATDIYYPQISMKGGF